MNLHNLIPHKYGLHTPETTTKYLELLNKECHIKFEDCSWGNDLTDSAYSVDPDIFVFFPNSSFDCFEEEKFSRFLVIYNRESVGKKEEEFSFDTIKEVIKELNSKH